MADPDLPSSVYQGLVWGPGADPNAAPPVPPPPDFGGLPLAVPQGMGWYQPPTPPPGPGSSPDLPSGGMPAPTDAPGALPSMQAQQPAPGVPPLASAAPDFKVSPSAFKGTAPAQPAPGSTATPATRPTQPTAPRPQSFGQQIADLEQSDQKTEQAQEDAVNASVDAQSGFNADRRQAFRIANATVEKNEADRQADREVRDKAFAKNQAKYDADRAAVDNWSFNRNKYMDSLGLGGKVRWGIAQILAGIGQGMMRQGGPNPVTQMLQQNVEDANNEQLKQRDAMVQKLGFDRESGKDAADYWATREAERDKANGTAYTILGKSIEEAAAKSADPMARAQGMKEAAAFRAMSDERRKSYIALQSQHDLQAQSNAIAGGHLALAQKQFNAEYGPQGFKQQELDLQAANLMRQGKAAQAKALQERGVGGLTIDGKPAADDGSNILLAPSDKEAEKLREQKAGVDVVNEFVNDMSRQIKEAGGSSKWLQSPDFQKMMAKKESLLFALHQAYGVSGFRPGALEQMEKALGGTDPTSFFRSAEPGLKEARDSLNRTFTAQLRVMDPRFKGEYKPPDTSTPLSAPETQEDKLFKVAAGSRNDDPGAVFNADTGRYDPKVSGYYSIDPWAVPKVPAATPDDQRISSEYPRMGAGQKAAIDVFASMARSDDPEMKDRGLAYLQSLANPPGKGGKANEDGVRGYAQELLNRVADEAVTSDTKPIEPTTGATDTPLGPYGRSIAPPLPVAIPPVFTGVPVRR